MGGKGKKGRKAKTTQARGFFTGSLPTTISGGAQNEFAPLDVSNPGLRVTSSLLWNTFGIGGGCYGKKNFQRIDELCVRFDTTKWFVVVGLFPVWPLGSYTLVGRRTFWSREIVSAVERPFDRGQVRTTILKGVTLSIIIVAIVGLIVFIFDKLFPPL